MPKYENTPIKINLNLHVIGQNEKNYHLLQSLIVFAEDGDKISCEISEEDEFIIKGPYQKALQNTKDDNLILKAYKSLKKHANKPLPKTRIILEKKLPISSGIGAGSGDAARAMLMLNKLWKLNLAPVQLQEIGKSIGADLPACLHYLQNKAPLFVSGIGEIITPLKKFPKLPIILINNHKPVPTEQIFCNLTEKNNPPMNSIVSFSSLKEVLSYLQNTRNDLYKVTSILEPSIITILKALKAKNALYTQMSGSGGTCFGIFPTITHAKKIEKELKAEYPDWYIKTMETTGQETTS